MISYTINKQIPFDPEAVSKTYFGLAADTKPTIGIANGSLFLEFDTGKVYFFNADGAAWVEFGSGAIVSEVVVAPEQSVTITSSPVSLTLAEGYTLPASTPTTGWTVTINGVTAAYTEGAGAYIADLSGSYGIVMIENGALVFAGMDSQMASIVAGTYTVKVVEAEAEGE